MGSCCARSVHSRRSSDNLDAQTCGGGTATTTGAVDINNTITSVPQDPKQTNHINHHHQQQQAVLNQARWVQHTTPVVHPGGITTTTTTTTEDHNTYRYHHHNYHHPNTSSSTYPHTTSMAFGATAVCTLASHSSDVNGVAFGGGVLASCGGDKTVKVWNLDDFTELGYSPLLGHRYSVNGCTFSPANNRVLVSYSTDGRAVVWDLKTGEQLAVLTHPSQASIKVCRFSPSGDVLATGSDDETLCLWDLASKKIIRSYEGHESSIPACAFSPCSAFIVCGNVHGYLKVFDTLGRVQQHLSYEMNAHDLGVTCCEFSPTYGSADGNTLVTEELPRHLLPGQQEEGDDLPAGVTGELLSADAPKVHYLLATCGYDNNIKLWDFVAYADSVSVKLTLRSTLSGHNDSVMCCTFSPNGQLLASAAGDKTVRLWDPHRGEPVYTILGHSRFVTCCAFSMDGTYLASGSNDRDVKVWRIARINQFTGEPEEVKQIVAMPRVEAAGAGRLDTAYYMKDLADWGVDEVSQWLSDLGMPQYVPQFRQQAIDGTELLTLTPDSLEKNFNIVVLGHRNKLARTIEELRGKPARQKQAAAKGVPDEFLCPITREIMSDPVIAADGFTYERQAIADWMKRGKMYSPMTNAVLSTDTLTPNRSVKMLLQRHLDDS